MNRSPSKTLILGLDGATWRLLSPLLAAEELPNLRTLYEQGASGPLQSSVPPLTAPAWTSFQTGSNPGKHDVYDFRIFDRKRRSLRLASSREIKAPTLWQIASAAGCRVIAINVPMTYPPQPVNGIVIGGMLAQRVDPGLISPASRFDEIFDRHPEYRISPPIISRRASMGRKAFIDANIEVEKQRCELALDLLRREEWDIFMLQNQCLDYVQHAYYHLMDTGAAEFDPAGHRDVLRFYQAMDENIGRMVEAAPPGTDIVLVSDHGFKLQHRLVHLSSWLRDTGYLVENINPRQRLMQLARQIDVFRLRRRLAHWLLRDKQARFGAAASMALARIDWEHSRAYAAIGSVYGFIFLGQNEGNETMLVQELTGRIIELKDPRTGQKVVDQVLKGEDVYSGPHALNGPDLILVPAEDYTFGAPSLISHRETFTTIDFELEIPGGHHPEGVFIWNGLGVNAVKGQPANLVDIAPSVLARLGIPVPNHMDGDVISSLFTPGLTPEYQDWDPGDNAKPPSGQYSEQDDQALHQRLSDLGYL